jgi:hypothetical protein
MLMLAAGEQQRSAADPLVPKSRELDESYAE